tara:strand:- start:212 stop:481 length:270 start_codon:yes stop_codon:yes gene_type:complete
MVEIHIDDDWDYENFRLIYSKVLKTKYTGYIKDGDKKYVFDYYTEKYNLPPKGPRIAWRTRWEVPTRIKERAFRNIQNFVNAIIKKESK